MKHIFNASLLILGLSAQAFAASGFEVTHCQSGSDVRGVRFDMTIKRQVRDAEGFFVDSGALAVIVDFNQSPTTLGALALNANSAMNWARQKDEALREFQTQRASSDDGSLFVYKMVSRDAFAGAIGQSSTMYNNTPLYYLKIKVADAKVDYLVLSLQGIDMSMNYHLQAEAVNGGGHHPLSQFDVRCQTSFP